MIKLYFEMARSQPWGKGATAAFDELVKETAPEVVAEARALIIER